MRGSSTEYHGREEAIGLGVVLSRFGEVGGGDMVWAFADCPAPDLFEVDGCSFGHFHLGRVVRRFLGRVTGIPLRGVRAALCSSCWWNVDEERMSDRRFFTDHLY